MSDLVADTGQGRPGGPRPSGCPSGLPASPFFKGGLTGNKYSPLCKGGMGGEEELTGNKY